MIKGRFISGILLAALALCVFQGCDSFRRLAGRPTSDEIAAKRELIQREEAAHQARMDSLSRIEKAKADSLALLDKIKDAQTADGIDTVSGATYSSKGILEAAAEAISESEG